jgi:hypothetical protein
MLLFSASLADTPGTAALRPTPISCVLPPASCCNYININLLFYSNCLYHLQTSFVQKQRCSGMEQARTPLWYLSIIYAEFLNFINI